MSYEKMMRWHKKHPRGGKIQPVLMHTNSGFWPSRAWSVGEFYPYLRACKRLGVDPVRDETLYRAQLGGNHQTPQQWAQATKTGELADTPTERGSDVHI